MARTHLFRLVSFFTLVVYISVNFGRIHIIDGFSRNLFHLMLLVVLVFFDIFSLVRHCDDDDED